MNLLDGRGVGSEVAVGEMRLATSEPVDGGLVLGLRPEHVRFGTRGIPGRVFALEPMGRDVLLTVEGPLGVVRVLAALDDVLPAEGDAVHLAIDPATTLLFERTTGRRLTGVTVAPALEAAA